MRVADNSQLMIVEDGEYERGVPRLSDDIERASARGVPLVLTSELSFWATTGWAAG